MPDATREAFAYRGFVQSVEGLSISWCCKHRLEFRTGQRHVYLTPHQYFISLFVGTASEPFCTASLASGINTG